MGLFDAFRSGRNAASPRVIDSVAHARALALISEGNSLEDAEQLEEALALYSEAVETAPDLPKGHLNLGNGLLAKGNPLAALKSYAKALVLNPDYAPAHYNCGNAHVALSQHTEAIRCYQAALLVDPLFVDALVALGFAQHHCSDYESAVSSYLRALELDPDYAEALNNLGLTYIGLNLYDRALDCFDRAVELKPGYMEPYYHRGLLHVRNKERLLAIRDFDKVLSINPAYSQALGLRLYEKMHLCDWSNYEQQRDLVLDKVEQGVLVTPGFPVLAITDSARHQLMSNVLWTQKNYPPRDTLGAISKHSGRSKIRVGYYSMDFNNHPVAFLTAGLYELHSRDEFEIYAFYFGPPVKDEMRLRLESAFDHFLDVAQKSDLEIARLSRHLEIDIAVDLAGHTGDAEPGIFALRAAPIQINYLGFPASMGATYMDYIIVDHATVPVAQRASYLEKLVFLPFFQANDFRRFEPVKKFSRETLGLPPKGFVFCCFNHSYKITPQMFSCWMRILAQVPNSVLFLYADNDWVIQNLRREAERSGIAPDRLVFGPRFSFLDNSSRYLEADLFLDTFPFNAGTTASDALWAGLLVLTCAGEAFASRMATSLLTALGLPELVSDDLETYEKRAVALATQPSLLHDLRGRLGLKRRDSVLCDSQTFTLHLEQAYRLMIERLDTGLEPADLDLSHWTGP